MQIENLRGKFDLTTDQKITIERTNPLLNDQGSISLTYPITRTDKNDYLLNFPAKYSRKQKYDLRTDVNIRAGLLNENATLQLTSVTSEQVEAVFLLYETSFYAKIKEVTLPTVFKNEERWFSDKTVDKATRISTILDLFETMIARYPSYDLDKDFTVFPVAANVEFATVTDANVTSYIGRATPENTLNDYVNINTSTKTIRLRSKTAYTYTDSDGNSITLPIGFGVTPFLRLGYVLRKVFEYFGFKLEKNIFDEGGKYRRVVLLNNTQDAIMFGYIIESQLVPDCTITDLLDIIREGFNADFFIDVPAKTARIVFFNDVISQNPDLDLTPFLTEAPEIEFSKETQLKLSVTKNLPNASTALDTHSGFIVKYPEDNGEFFAPIKEFLFNNCILKETVYIKNSTYYTKQDWLSSLNFDYYTEEDIETEDHTIPFEAPVTFPNANNLGIPVVAINSLRRLNTSLTIDGIKQNNEDVECPLITCAESYDSRLLPITNSIMNGYGRRGNMAEEVDPSGLEIINLYTWGENGLFASFWKNYDQLLRKSFHTITTQCRIPAKVLQNFDFTKLKLIDGQPCIVNKLTYELTDESVVDVEIELKTVKIYED